RGDRRERPAARRRDREARRVGGRERRARPAAPRCGTRRDRGPPARGARPAAARRPGRGARRPGGGARGRARDRPVRRGGGSAQGLAADRTSASHSVWRASCWNGVPMSSPRNTAGHALVKDWKWLDAFAKFFDWIVGGFYKIPGTGWIRTLLHGTWPLGHPLHPAITDITIGAYTAAVALDVAVAVTGDLTLTRAADFVLVVAFISSLISIVSGFTDWQYTFGEEKRTGMLNALIMLTVPLVFLISIILRGTAPDARGFAMWLSGISWAVMLVGAFFGGEMPYGYGTEVNRQACEEQPSKWTKLDVAARGLDDRKPVVGKAK